MWKSRSLWQTSSTILNSNIKNAFTENQNETLGKTKGLVSSVWEKYQQGPHLVKVDHSNIYLFRHVTEDKVIVSPTFELDTLQLQQVGDLRPNLKLRRDHWIPFCVLTGISNPNIKNAILKEITTYLPRLSKHRYKPNNSILGCYTPWQPTESMKKKIQELCESVNKINIAKDLELSQTSRSIYINIINDNPSYLQLLTKYSESEKSFEIEKKKLLNGLKGRMKLRVNQALSERYEKTKINRINKVVDLIKDVPSAGDTIHSSQENNNTNTNNNNNNNNNNVLNDITIVRSSGLSKISSEQYHDKMDRGIGVLPQLGPWTIWWENTSLANCIESDTQSWPESIVQRKMEMKGKSPLVPGVNSSINKDIGHYVVQYPITKKE